VGRQLSSSNRTSRALFYVLAVNRIAIEPDSAYLFNYGYRDNSHFLPQLISS